MNLDKNDLRAEVSAYCASIGSDPLLVQGAGGNISWKDGDTLWVKASGTWLADAAESDIFVPADLAHLREAIKVGNFEIAPLIRGDSHLRPSIETLLHALMPQRIVVHVHAVEVLAHLVRAGFRETLSHASAPGITWTCVRYLKPGAALATGVAEALADTPDSNVVFLQNHGVVIGAGSIAEANATLLTLTDIFRTAPRAPVSAKLPTAPISSDDTLSWVPIGDPLLHQLAIDPALFERLHEDWALYPDHVVFLGARAVMVSDEAELPSSLAMATPTPDVVFIRGKGVFTLPTFNTGKQAQIRCYYDVLARQDDNARLSSLSDDDICGLLNWDSERYRIQMAK